MVAMAATSAEDAGGEANGDATTSVHTGCWVEKPGGERRERHWVAGRVPGRGPRPEIKGAPWSTSSLLWGMGTKSPALQVADAAGRSSSAAVVTGGRGQLRDDIDCGGAWEQACRRETGGAGG